MVTHKSIEKICVIITAIAIIVTILFMNGSSLGVTAIDSVSFEYEESLFDDSYVHSINIEIDDWDSFIETATSEEYTAVNVTIDGETVNNVGLRAKGNTSLSTVSQLDSERYSLKLEFDAYDSGTTYQGLDKLCLNNLIQDYTMMKDYITYKLMNEFGVASPLVSYVYVTVNGEDWGLFLAVEAVEDSFLERNYGTSYGDLYKPDNLSMGGGRGNGGDFDMKDIDFDKLGMDNPFEKNGDSSNGDSNAESKENDSSGKENSFSGSSASSEDSASEDGNTDQKPDGMPDFSELEDGQMPDFGEAGEGGFPGGGGFGMGSDDAKLKYIDDDTDSYSSIFDSAKTTVNKADKKRLINSIKTLSEGIETGDADTIAEAVDVDALMRYMVVHNFVVNGDSYTGSMIHNYYLYEEDGLMTFIPWDYNLAFGTFQASDADSAVNDPIDTPLSITEGDTDRPMFAWITSNEEYTEMYHEYYEEFLELFYTSGYLEDLIDSTYEMIYSYVEKDPTKFCELSEFETAVETIKEFVELRCQSISGQLDGTIGSIDEEQEENPDALIDASSITLSDMGSMGAGMGGGSNGGQGSGGPGSGEDGPSSEVDGQGGPGSGGDGQDGPSSDVDDQVGDHGGPSGSNDAVDSSSKGGGSSDNADSGQAGDSSEDSSFGGPSGDFPSGDFSGDFPSGDFPGGDFTPGDFPGGDFSGGDFEGFGSATTIDKTNYIYLAASVVALIAATVFVMKYRNRR